MDAPEFKLLLACCRFSYASDAIAEIHRWSGHVDWPVVLRLARRHRVQSLVAQAFYKAKMPPPPSIAAGIADDAAAIAETNLRSAAESIRLCVPGAPSSGSTKLTNRRPGEALFFANFAGSSVKAEVTSLPPGGGLAGTWTELACVLGPEWKLSWPPRGCVGVEGFVG